MPKAEYLAQKNLEALAENQYPGRGIVIGRTIANEIVQVYWVMGRSDNSRNRILEREGSVIRTAPYDPSKVEDPSLIIYNAMAQYGLQHVVSNGDQTDTVIDYLRKSGTGATHIGPALRTRDFEPDAPNFTPRITGATNGLSGTSLFWLTRRFGYRSHHSYLKDRLETEGIGRCLHTYQGDGDPLPSFEDRPYLVPVDEGAEDTAQLYWDHLNQDNRVSLAAKTIQIARDGKIDFHIINRLPE